MTTRRRSRRRRGRLVLVDSAPTHDALREAFADILAYAREQSDRALADPESAVHEFRKAVRRARAMVALCRLSLDEDGDAIATELRDAHRELSALRDRDVLPGVLEGLELDDALAALRGRARRALARDRGRGQREGAGAAAAVAAAATHVAQLPARFAAALSADVTWGDVAKGARRSYRRTRRALRRWSDTGDDESFHDWRKRTKELAYQLELLRGHYPRAAELRAHYAALAKQLGEVTDLMQLRERLSDPRWSALREQVERVRAEKAQAAREVGGALFADKPRIFAEQL